MEQKRLLRNRTERIIGGVAGGIATYFGIDPLIVRVILVALSLVNGLGLVIYIVLWLLMPVEGSSAPDTRSQVQENIHDMQDTSIRFVNQVREMLRSEPR